MPTTPTTLLSVPAFIETQLLPTSITAPDTALSEMGHPPKSAVQIFNVMHVNVAVTVDRASATHQAAVSLLKTRRSWADQESRELYAEAAVEQGLAYQIKVNREMRDMSQRKLASLMDTQQSAVSRMEDPDYGSQSIPKLLKVAHAFDCALLIKLIPFSMLAVEAEHLSEHDLYARGYAEELQEA